MINREQIEAVYPLSPLQEGILFETLYRPEVAEYLVQCRYLLEGELEIGAFRWAWEKLLERHAVLRTAFVWKQTGKASQIVLRSLELPLEQQDWRGLTVEEQELRRQRHLEENRKRRFDLSRAPLFGVSLLRLGERVYEMHLFYHHIILDGWSNTLLLKEMMTWYKAGQRGQELKLPCPRPYREYIGWLQKLDGGAAEAFWRRYLKGLEMPTLLPFDAGAAGEGYAKEKQEILLSATATTALRSLARQHQLTLNTIVQGAWAILLGRYSGQQDVLFGATVAGRPSQLDGFESMIGLFINTVPVRTQLDGRRKVREWLQQLQARQMEVYQYEHTPLVKIHEYSELPRDARLFETILVFENYATDAFETSYGVSLRADEKRVRLKTLGMLETPHRTISLGCIPANQLRLGIMHSAAGTWWTTKTLQSMRNILEAIASHSELCVGDLEVMSGEEREQLLAAGRGVEREYGEGTVQGELEKQAGRCPDRIALVRGEEHLSYGELNGRSNQVGHYLRSLGVGSEVKVGLYGERSLEMVVGLWGVLKAGGAYVVLESKQPGGRIAGMVEDAGIGVILTEEERREKLPASWAQVISVDGEWEEIGKQSREDVEWEGGGENLAYALYTSGSTGKAKAVGIEHRQLWNYVQGVVERLGLKECQSYGLVTTLAADLGHTVLYPGLTGGGRVEVMGEWEGGEVREELERAGVDCLKITPSYMKALLESGGEGEEVVPWKRLVLGGEGCSREWAEGLAEKVEGCQIWNHYGPTECTVGASVYAVRGEEGGARERTEGKSEMVPIGRPIANTEVYVLDEEMRLAPVGVAGELYIGGAGLARGYLGRPELTAERFVPHRYGKRGGERLYRTGDQVRWRGDGNLEFLGRRDEQVKIRGYRIELGEIEAVLGEHSAVKQAVVVAREGKERGEKRLVAYVVEGEREGGENEKGEQGERKEQGEKRTRVEGEQLRRHLRERLPEYMVPSAYVVLEEMPLTANGKLDRKRLPEPEEMTRKEERGGEARTPVEEIVAGIWEQVLKVEGVGVEDNFFELGGHSLLATQVISRVRNALQVELGMRVVFEQPTVRGMAEEVEKMRGEGTGVVLPRLERRDTRETEERRETRLSFAQQRLWFIEQLEPGGATYNVPHAVRLQGKVDEVALERSFREIVRRHEVLRSRIVMSEAGEAVQRVEREWRLEVGKVDVGGVESGEEREELAKKIAVEEASRGFDLGQGRLLRVKLVEVEEEEQVLLVTMHHIVSDGWSAGVLVREFGELYEAYGKGEESGLEELEVQYGDYAEWQREWLRGEVLEEQVRYWKRELEGLETLELEGDYVRPGVRTHCGGRVRVEVGEETTRKLKQVSREQGVTLFMVILGALQVLLWRWSGQKDIAVGTPIAGRRQAEVEGLIGFFVNQLVLRTRWEGEPGFVEMLGRVREMVLGAYEHQDLPFEKLVEEMQPERDLGRSPLFQVMLVWQNAPRERLRLGGLELSGFSSAGDVAKFDLTLALGESGSGSENGNRIVGSLEYAGDLFKEETAARLVGQLERVLQAIADEPERRIGEIEILSAKEREQLLEEWNGREAEVEEKTVAELFAEQASRRPEAVALVYEDSSLSYGELERRAEQLAEYLRGRGVGPEVLVGICLERSLELVLALLGVLKAGGAYVPLDPEYPRQRLEHMLKDAQPAVLITQEKLWAGIAVEGVKEVCCVEGKAEAWAGEGIREGGRKKEKEERRAVARSEAGNLAYVIFTSGSSGRAKGVGIGHGGLSNLIAVERAELGIREGTTVLQFSSASFDASVWEWAAALAGGGRLVLGSKEEMLPGTPLVEFLQRHEVEIMTVPPSILKIAGEGNLPGLRTLVVAGEACTGELVAGWAKGRRMLNAYGPTEGTVCATMTAELEGREQPPIGRPIANTEVYVLDEEMRLAPVGVAGELYIGGAGLARGYLGRPELTAERFVPHRYGKRGGERLYRTGDQVRWRGDGNLEFLGRRDEQVKIRGYRIELGEIEAVLGEHSAVKQAVVVAREGKERGEKRLVAYVVEGEREGGENEKGEQGERKEQGEKRTRVEGEQLRRHLRERLPEYMVPSAYVVLEEMPLTANGKLDRKRLPEPEAGRGESYVGARTAVEELLVKVWEQVLGVPRVGVEDNFFELGGDSILSLRIVGRARQVGLQFSVRDVFQYQTIAELGARAGRGKEVEAEQGEVREGVELTPIQQWFFEQEWGGRNHFNQAVLLEAREGLDEVLLEALMERLVEHHDALRMRFAVEEVKEVKEEEQGEVWRQRNLGVEEERGERRGGRKEGRKEGRWEGGGEPVLSSIDLRAVEAEGRRAALEEAAARLQGSLDLEDGPLLRAAYFRMGEQSGRLLIIIHHLVVDGVSWRVLLEDVERGYEQLRGGQKLRMPGKTTSFQQWARGLSQYVRSGGLEGEREYWEKVEGEEGGRLPREEGEGKNTVASSRNHRVQLGREETEYLLQQLPRKYGWQMQEALLAALVEGLVRWTGGGGAWRIDMEGHGREAVPGMGGVDVSRTVGWFTSLYPVVVEGEEGERMEERLERVGRRLAEIPQHGIGYGLLRYGEGGEQGRGDKGQREQGRRLGEKAGAAEISFNYLGQFEELGREGLLVGARESKGPLRSAEGERNYVLEVNSSVQGGQLQMNFTYSTNLHRAETIAWLVQNVVEALDKLIRETGAVGSSRQPGERLEPLEENNGAAWDKILAELNAGESA